MVIFVIPLTDETQRGIMGITEKEVHLLGQEELMNQIAEIEREIALLPEGSITKKRIKEKEYFYHRITKNGKRIENYLSFQDVSGLETQIAKRKELEKELKRLKALLPQEEKADNEEVSHKFKTMVRFGKALKAQIAITKKYKKRECISGLREYIFG